MGNAGKLGLGGAAIVVLVACSSSTPVPSSELPASSAPIAGTSATSTQEVTPTTSPTISPSPIPTPTAPPHKTLGDLVAAPHPAVIAKVTSAAIQEALAASPQWAAEAFGPTTNGKFVTGGWAGCETKSGNDNSANLTRQESCAAATYGLFKLYDTSDGSNAAYAAALDVLGFAKQSLPSSYYNNLVQSLKP